MKTLTILLVGLVPFLIGGCSPNYTEVSRASNKSNLLDVVVAEREVGATVSTPIEIFILPKGGEIQGESVFRADKVDQPLSVSWDTESHLTIHGQSARIFKYKSEIKSVDGAKIVIQLDIKFAKFME